MAILTATKEELLKRMRVLSVEIFKMQEKDVDRPLMHYARGFANGLIEAYAIMSGTSPDFIGPTDIETYGFDKPPQAVANRIAEIDRDEWKYRAEEAEAKRDQLLEELDELEARAEAAEAKLADLRKQLGDGFRIQVPGWEYDWGPEEDREDDE